MTLSVVILAAGKSTRFESATPKVLHSLGERPMIEHLLRVAEALTPEAPVIVVGPETETLLRAWGGERARFALQTQRAGTAHAVLQARDLLCNTPGQVLVLYGDMPLLRQETLARLVTLHRESSATLSMLTVIRSNSLGFGRVLRNAEGQVLGVIEEPEATEEQLAIQELNAGIYVFEADFLWSHLPQIKPSAKKGEYYLTDMVGLAAQYGRHVEAMILEDPHEAVGINTREDFALAHALLKERINRRWMLSGVTLIDPSSTYIGPEVNIGRDTVIHPNTHLRGSTSIGEASTIGPNAIIESSIIGDRCRVLASVLEYAVMEDDSDIGPFSHLRKGAHLGQGAHVGNFGELKNSTLGPGAKMGHFSYLGDATVGAAANIGAGTITCNFDGEKKHPTVIEEQAFIGSDSLLVAPVRVGAGAKTGAGSVVTRDIPPHTLAYGVPARVHKALKAVDAPSDPEREPAEG